MPGGHRAPLWDGIHPNHPQAFVQADPEGELAY
jgi:hypothetical protein